MACANPVQVAPVQVAPGLEYQRTNAKKQRGLGTAPAVPSAECYERGGVPDPSLPSTHSFGFTRKISPSAEHLEAFDQLAVNKSCKVPQSAPPSPPGTPTTTLTIHSSSSTSQIVMSVIVISFSALACANPCWVPGASGDGLDVITIMMAIATLFVFATWLPRLRLHAPIILVGGTCLGSIFALVVDMMQPADRAFVAIALGQFTKAPLLSMAGQLVFGVLLGTQPLRASLLLLLVCASIAGWTLNIMLAYLWTEEPSLIATLLPRTVLPLSVGTLMGMAVANMGSAPT